MSKRRQIARYAAAQAARAAYTAIMNAPLRKVATARGQKTVGPSKESIAKIAGNAAYQSIMRLGQMSFPAPDESNVQGTARSLGFNNIADYMGGDKRVHANARAEVPGFLDAFYKYKVDQGAPPNVASQHVEIVKEILKKIGL